MKHVSRAHTVTMNTPSVLKQISDTHKTVRIFILLCGIRYENQARYSSGIQPGVREDILGST
jgi:hypothetical protein